VAQEDKTKPHEPGTMEMNHPMITLLNRMKYTYIPSALVDQSNNAGSEEIGDVEMFESSLTLVMSRGGKKTPSVPKSTAPAAPAPAEIMTKEREFPESPNPHAHVSSNSFSVLSTHNSL